MYRGKTYCIILISVLVLIGCLKPPEINIPVPDLSEQTGFQGDTGAIYKVDICRDNLERSYINIEINGYVPKDIDLSDRQNVLKILEDAYLFSIRQKHCIDNYASRVVEVFLFPHHDVNEIIDEDWTIYAKSYKMEMIDSIPKVKWAEIINYHEKVSKEEADTLIENNLAKNQTIKSNKNNDAKKTNHQNNKQIPEKLKEEIEKHTKIIENNPNNSSVYNNRGFIYYSGEMYQKAIDDFSKAIALDPNNFAAYNNRGNAYDQLGKTKEALADLTKAIDINEKYVDAYYNRGTLLLKMNFPRRALEDFNHATEIDQKHYKAIFYKATVLENLGQRDDAIDAYRDFIRYVPPEFEKEIEFATNKIEQLSRAKN